jgi:FkbM family methyltransferase
MPVDRLFRPAGAAERMARKIYSGALQRLGLVPHVVRAQGARFLVDPSDYIDRCVAYDGMWDAPQLNILADVASRGPIDLFLDVGANTGFYSIMFAIKRLAGRIVAFEPDRGNFARLQANIEASGLMGAIDAVPLALGDRAGDVTLYEGAKWNRGESTVAVPEQTPQAVTYQVRQVRFDDEYSIADKSIIVKMDVEGHEFAVIEGMARTLRDNRCLLQIEHYGERHEELKAAMARLGYRHLHTEYIDHYFTNIAGLDERPLAPPP